MNVCWDSGGTAPLILNYMANGWKLSGHFNAPAALPHENNPGTHYTRGWMSPKSPFGRFGGKPLATAGIQATDRPAFSLATISTTLYRPNIQDTQGVENKQKRTKRHSF
jgi:hypothetical protein